MFHKHTTLVVFLSIACMAPLAADQVIMKNGDRVTGSIVKKDGKDLVVKTDQFGVVTAAWDQVESIKVDKPLSVVLKDGKTVQATLTTTGGKVEVSGQGANISVVPAEITTIRNAEEQHAYERMLAPRLLDLWAGSASAGLAGTAGNARTSTFTVGVLAARVTRTDKTTLHFETIKASALLNGKNQQTAQAVRGGIGYDHNAGSRLFLNVFNDYEYDRFQNLDLRFVLGGGAGFHAMKKERTRLDLLGGIDFNRSSYSTPLVTKAAEFYWGDEFNFKLSGATSLTQTFRMFNDLSHTGDYRMNGDIGASTKIAKWLTWNLALSDRYLSHPAAGRKTNDFLYTTGLGITFAR